MCKVLIKTMSNKFEHSITVSKTDNFSDWYKQIITKGEFIEYSDISGCYIFLPNAYSIWEKIQSFIDSELKKNNVQNVYFPLFISKKNLEKEKNHIEGFTPEVAWVTKSGSSELSEPIAVRPTSECAIYSILPNIIKSHNDLPLKYNQWCSVVRWEFKDCIPFLRSREILWGEIHNAYKNNDEASKEVMNYLQLYKNVYENLLAVPVIMGKKTKNETFAGADSTYTIEAYIPVAGKGIQAATSHNLGQNFSKMFDIKFQDIDKQNKNPYQISCGITTRSIGIMLMNHGDDKGAIIPPSVAQTQIVIIPIIKKNRTDDVLKKCIDVYNILRNKFRVHIDTSDHNPGWKFNFWETRGVPLRIEIGPMDVDKNTLVVSRRDTFEKTVITCDDDIINKIDITIQNIHNNLYNRANDQLRNNIGLPNDLNEFVKYFDDKKLCLVKWCENNECENYIKEHCNAKPLCIPLDLSNNINTDKCCICGRDANDVVLFGRSY